ncbi:MAG: hypothetical protein AAFN77_17295 [Planctomycetota bacterium]
MIRQIHYKELSGWPPLAWLAKGRAGDSSLSVYHGPQVETNEDWFGEVVWDGDYEQAGFHLTDVVVGSAGRLVDGEIVFVASGNTLDRIVSIEIEGEVFVSNSIVCLAAYVDAKFNAWYPAYANDFKSIIHGLDDYVQTIPSSRGPIRLTYYRNLKFDGDWLTQIEKPGFDRQRNSSDSYRDFLLEALGACVENMGARTRAFPFQMVGTLSSGFDSTTAAALGKQFGLEEAFTIRNSRGGGSDCGTPIGDALGLRVHEIERNKWREYPLTETLFLSADAKGEDVYFRGAGELLSRKVVLTGFSGSIWGGKSSSYVKWIRTDQSGLSLTEYRLHIGAIHLPVPSIGTYMANDVLEVMGQDEMKAWANGKAYDKPFCRKILTEAGVPDGLYGIEKKAASVLIEDRSSFLSDESLNDFENYLKDLFLAEPAMSRSYHTSKIFGGVAKAAVKTGQAIAGTLGKMTSIDLLNRIQDSVRLSEYASSEASFRFLFPWAIEHAKKRYQSDEF